MNVTWMKNIRAEIDSFNEERIHFLDVEATGLDEHDRIVQIGITNCKGKVLMDQIVDPGIPIPERVTLIHGISNEMVKGFPSWEDVWEDVFNLLRDAKIGVYNKTFDFGIINREGIRVGGQELNESSFFDLQYWYKKFFGLKYTPKLVDAVKNCGVNLDLKAHDAINDAFMAKAIYDYINSWDLKKINNYEITRQKKIEKNIAKRKRKVCRDVINIEKEKPIFIHVDFVWDGIGKAISNIEVIDNMGSRYLVKLNSNNGDIIEGIKQIIDLDSKYRVVAWNIAYIKQNILAYSKRVGINTGLSFLDEAVCIQVLLTRFFGSKRPVKPDEVFKKLDIDESINMVKKSKLGFQYLVSV